MTARLQARKSKENVVVVNSAQSNSTQTVLIEFEVISTLIDASMRYISLANYSSSVYMRPKAA